MMALSRRGLLASAAAVAATPPLAVVRQSASAQLTVLETMVDGYIASQNVA